MTTLREAAQQALEALEAFMQDSPRPYDALQGQAAMDALRAALAEPVQEPVAWIHTDPDNVRVKFLVWRENEPAYRGVWIKTPLFTAQPQRKSLTDEVIADLWHKNGGFHHHFARAVERWLRGHA